MRSHLFNTIVLLSAAVVGACLSFYIGIWFTLLVCFVGYAAAVFTHWTVNPPNRIKPGWGWAIFVTVKWMRFAALSSVAAAIMFTTQQSPPGSGAWLKFFSIVLIIAVVISGINASHTLFDRAPAKAKAE